MLPREIEISTHTRVHDMSPIDSYGYGNPSDEQTYEEEEHAQHPDAALEHNNSSQQTTSTDTSVTLLSNDTSNTTVPPSKHQQQSNAVLCTNSKPAISLLFDQRPKKSKQQIALEEQLDELYGESDDEDLLNEFKKRRDEGTLPIKRKCENTHEYPSQQVSTCPSQQNLNNRFIPPPKTINSRAPSSMRSSISSSTSAGSKLYPSQQINNCKQRSTKKQNSMKNRFIPPTPVSKLAKRWTSPPKEPIKPTHERRASWIPPPKEPTEKQRAQFSSRFQPRQQLVQKGERAPRVTNGNDKGKTTPSPKVGNTTPKANNTSTPKSRKVATVSPPVPSDDSSPVVPNSSSPTEEWELALTDENKKEMAYRMKSTGYYYVGNKPDGVTSLHYKIVENWYWGVQNNIVVELPNLPGATFYHLRLAIEGQMKGCMPSFKFRVLGYKIDCNQEENLELHHKAFEKEISEAGGDEKAADGSLLHPYTIYITYN